MLIHKKDILPITRKSIKIILFNPIYQNFSIYTIPFIVLPLFFFGCSQEKNTFVSKNFHNTTARYNAYFLAREKMKEVDAQIWQNNADDYNRILKVYPEISEVTVGVIKPGLEEVIKKASLIPEKHKNSNWLDDSYTIIGKSYLYKKEYKTSLSFFKFVNSKSEDTDARHAALVLLMKTYIDSVDYLSAKMVSEYLNKKLKQGENLDEDNFRDFSLTQAYYHQKLDEYDKMLPLLEKSVDLIHKKDERARTHFIIGQLYQMFGKDSAAYQHYNAATKRNPPYELFFHSKLYMAQVAQGEGKKAEKRMDKLFKKLLADRKNEEYKDKIYYEMGQYELRRKREPEAISNFEKSLRANTKNIPLKGFTYLKLGEIYYDNYQFRKSKLYYDSTIATWDKEDKRYKEISTRQKVLAEFAGYVETVEREDSLQRLAKMPKEKLDTFIDKIISDEKEKKKKEAEAAEKAKELAALNALNNKNNPINNNLTNEESTFALSNPASIGSGITAFRKVWGNRKLEDNWRRSQKEKSFVEETTEENTTASQPDSLSNKEENKEETVNKDIYYKDIPFTKAQMDTSNKKVEVALYHIGKIYDQKLNEPKKSIKEFDKLLNRFPESEYTPEVYYFMYLIYKDLEDLANSEKYKKKLLNEFPRSLYAKLIDNPNYLRDNKIANIKAHEKYRDAYMLYENGDYKAADSLIKIIKIEFADNDIDDKLTLLSIINFGQTGNPLAYKAMLENYIQDYKNSPLSLKAKDLLIASESFIASKNKNGETIGSTDVKYSTDLNRPHILVTILPKNIQQSKIVKDFQNFNKVNSEKQKLKVQFHSFSDSTYIVLVNGFEEKFNAQVYINNLKDEKSFFKKNGYIQHPVFIISNYNYQLFYDSKNLEGYLKFFKNNY